MKTAIVTDSTAYLTEAEIKKYHITVVPIPVIFGTQSFKEGVDISSGDFYQKLSESPKIPTTSQPPMGELINTYNLLAEKGYDTVISIHLTSTISGMMREVANVAATLDNIRVIPFDSELTVNPMAEMTIYAAKLAQQGTNPDEIIDKLKAFRTTVDELFVVDDLQNLVKGGRLSNAAAFVGGMLNIKPILTFDDTSNEIIAFDKVRTKKKALKRVENLFSEALEKIDYPVKAAVLNANSPHDGEVWKKQIEEKFPDVKVVSGRIGPVIGTHLGSGALALAWYRNIEE